MEELISGITTSNQSSLCAIRKAEFGGDPRRKPKPSQIYFPWLAQNPSMIYLLPKRTLKKIEKVNQTPTTVMKRAQPSIGLVTSQTILNTTPVV